VATATVRNRSSSILRRIGGQRLETDGTELPRYYDDRYGCEMEILRFTSVSMNPRYQGWTDQIRNSLLTVPVLCQAGEDTDSGFSVNLEHSEVLA
jgi:hypothetical protein